MILGREVALWAAAFKALIAMVSLWVINLTIDQQGALNALVAILLAILVAVQVKLEKALAFVVGLVEAGFYVAVAFGWDLPADKQAVALTLVGAVVAVITRDRVVAPVDEQGNRR